MRASAGISSGSSSSSSALNTDATEGFALPGALDDVPSVILMGALGLVKPIEILLMRGGGGGAGTSSSDSSHLSTVLCLSEIEHIDATLILYVKFT